MADLVSWISWPTLLALGVGLHVVAGYCIATDPRVGSAIDRLSLWLLLGASAFYVGASVLLFFEPPWQPLPPVVPSGERIPVGGLVFLVLLNWFNEAGPRALGVALLAFGWYVGQHALAALRTGVPR